MMFPGSNLMTAVAAILLATAAIPARADNQPSREHAIKAAFIFHFVEFTDWPAGAFANADSPLIIVVAGSSPMKIALEQAIKDKTTRGRRLIVRQDTDGDGMKGAHLLYIDASTGERTKAMLDQVREQCALTVGDAGDFTQAGGCIRLFTEDNKPRFEISVKAAERARLKISSKLLKLAKMYND